MTYLLVIDQGTTSSRAIIFNERAQIQAVGQYEITAYFPEDGWVEQDPEEIWLTTLKSCREALRLAGLTAKQIASVGITNQRETTIVWNRRTGKPIYRAIVWQDRRTAALCDQLKVKGLGPLISKKTGLLLDPYFSATKLSWILEHVEGAREQAEQGDLLFGTIETWLLWQLTQGHSHFTDITNASRTLLFNLQQQQWDEELLAIFNIPEKMLPVVKDNAEWFGEVAESWLGAAIPICAMIGDQQAAAFGQACFHQGMIKSTYGTGCFMLLHTGETPVFSQHKLLTTIQYRIGDQIAYGLEGSIFIAGAAVQWLRDNLKLIGQSSEIQSLAEAVPDNGGVYFIPAFTGLGAPYWNPHARGLIAGLTRDTQPGHLARAVLEAVCYQTRDLVLAMQEEGATIDCLRVDGGMTKNNALLTWLANIVGVRVERPQVIETTALGAAFLAGLQIGLYGSLSDVECLWKSEQVFTPDLPLAERDEMYEKWLHWVSCC